MAKLVYKNQVSSLVLFVRIVRAVNVALSNGHKRINALQRNMYMTYSYRHNNETLLSNSFSLNLGFELFIQGSFQGLIFSKRKDYKPSAAVVSPYRLQISNSCIWDIFHLLSLKRPFFGIPRCKTADFFEMIPLEPCQIKTKIKLITSFDKSIS